MKMKTFTFIFDYLWLLSVFWCADKYIDNELTPLKASLTLSVFIFAFFRDVTYMIIFNDKISKSKLNFKPDLELLISFTKDTLFFGASLAFLTYVNLFYWKSMFCDIKKSANIISGIYIDSFILIVSKELQLEFFHRLMHENNYFVPKKVTKEIQRIHKLHHKTTTDLWTLNAFYVELADSVMESLLAPIILFIVKFSLGHELKVHLGSFLLFIIFDLHCHSANPYTQALYNPFLDHIFKCTVSHNIHHVYPSKNYRQIPLHHLFNSKRNKDIELYNKVHQTNFS